MKRIDDKVKFEYRSEVQSILNVLAQWREEHNDVENEDVDKLLQMLDYMDMCW